MEKVVKPLKLSPFRLAHLLRLEPDPSLSLQLFLNPNPNSSKPFRHSARCYDLIICKLGKAQMFPEMEQILDQMAADPKIAPKEALFCHVISFYGRARMPAAAAKAFDRIPAFRCRRTIKSFNSFLHALLACGRLDQIEALRTSLDAAEHPADACTYNILIRAKASSGSIADACNLFEEMRQRGIQPTVATFGTLISALVSNSELKGAFKLKDEMWRVYKVKPNVYIYTSLIKGLCKKNEVELAMKLKNEMLLDSGLGLDSAVYSTVIRALFRAGRKAEVVGVLEEMKQAGIEPDVVTYNAMIAGFCGDEKNFVAAFEALREMERKGVKPDVVSYNTIVLGLCKEGRWRDAKDLFEDMPRRGCRPDVVSYRGIFEGMCEAGEVAEAGLVLGEMVFKGYLPGAGSVRKLVEGLSGKGESEWVSAGKVVCTLAKVNSVASEGWEMAITGLLKKSELLKVAERVDSLRIG